MSVTTTTQRETERERDSAMEPIYAFIFLFFLLLFLASEVHRTTPVMVFNSTSKHFVHSVRTKRMNDLTTRDITLDNVVYGGGLECDSSVSLCV